MITKGVHDGISKMPTQSAVSLGSCKQCGIDCNTVVASLPASLRTKSCVPPL